MSHPRHAPEEWEELDQLPPSILPLHRRLLDDGRRWRAETPTTARLARRQRTLAERPPTRARDRRLRRYAGAIAAAAAIGVVVGLGGHVLDGGSSLSHLGAATAVRETRTASPLAGPSYAATASWMGRRVMPRRVSAPPGGFADAAPLGQLRDFRTTDPTFACLNGQPLEVWAAPQDPGVLFVSGICSHAMATWEFPRAAAGSLPRPGRAVTTAGRAAA